MRSRVAMSRSSGDGDGDGAYLVNLATNSMATPNSDPNSNSNPSRILIQETCSFKKSDENCPVWCILFKSGRLGSFILALMDVSLICFLDEHVTIETKAASKTKTANQTSNL